jgi:catechol 2,3-dioxygenase-like lactoylglutathione lyase family enzyme
MIGAQAIFETVLYARDLAGAERFYRDVFGLEVLERWEVLVAFRCGPGVLLVFNPDLARRPDRGVPSHGGDGPGHVAFAMPLGEADEWKRRFAALGVDIEMEVEWPEGGRSLYVRDPAGNSVELAPPTLWGGGWRFAGSSA